MHRYMLRSRTDGSRCFILACHWIYSSSKRRRVSFRGLYIHDQKTVVLSASAPAEAIPAEGTIIIAPITEKTPAGLLVKVVSVSGNVLTTEPASLEEAFEELHVDTTMDISPYLLHCIDNEGNITKPEFMTKEEWEVLMPQTEDTKAEVSVSQEFTPVSFPFEDGEFKGSLYMKLEVVAFNVRTDRLPFTLVSYVSWT